MSHPDGAPPQSPSPPSELQKEAIDNNAPKERKSNVQVLPSAVVNKEPGMVAPPDHFAVVEPGLYRSSLPTTNNFSHLRSLCLNRVIIVSAERPTRGVTNLFESNNIQVSHTGLHAWTAEGSWKPIAEEVVKESLEIMLRRDCYPILVCDVGGIHLVGMVIGCLRRLQNWNLNSVVSEYRFFARAKTRYANEQFIELFDIDLVAVPEDPPLWFAEQLEQDRRDQEEFHTLIAEGRVDESGTLLDPEKTPRYVAYRYSSSGPLNSEIGGIEPRIQTL